MSKVSDTKLNYYHKARVGGNSVYRDTISQNISRQSFCNSQDRSLHTHISK